MASKFARPGSTVFTVEEGVVQGGFGSAVREILDREGRCDIRFKSIGLPIEIYPVGKAEEIRKAFHLDADGLTEEFRAVLRS